MGKFVGPGFMVYYSSVGAGHTPGLTTWIVQSVLLFAAMVVCAHKIFELITHLPDKVIRWVGQMNDDLGTGESDNRIRGIAVAGAGYIARGGAQTYGSVKGAGPPSSGGGGRGGEGSSSKQTEDLSTP